VTRGESRRVLCSVLKRSGRRNFFECEDRPGERSGVLGSTEGVNLSKIRACQRLGGGRGVQEALATVADGR
jgi:hypothetical protein